MGGKSGKQLLMISVQANKDEDIKKIIAVLLNLLRNILNFWTK